MQRMGNPLRIESGIRAFYCKKELGFNLISLRGGKRAVLIVKLVHGVAAAETLVDPSAEGLFLGSAKVADPWPDFFGGFRAGRLFLGRFIAAGAFSAEIRGIVLAAEGVGYEMAKRHASTLGRGVRVRLASADAADYASAAVSVENLTADLCGYGFLGELGLSQPDGAANAIEPIFVLSQAGDIAARKHGPSVFSKLTESPVEMFMVVGAVWFA